MTPDSHLVPIWSPKVSGPAAFLFTEDSASPRKHSSVLVWEDSDRHVQDTATKTVFLPAFSCVSVFREAPDQDQDANSPISAICLSKNGKPQGAAGAHP